jgi:hypothetical protein
VSISPRRLGAVRLSIHLAVASYVLTRLPEFDDFVGGFTRALQPRCAATFDCQQHVHLVAAARSRTLYYEDRFYVLLTAVDRIAARKRLDVFDVEEIATHNGTLRVFA